MITWQRWFCSVLLSHRYFLLKIICIKSSWKNITGLLETEIKALIRNRYIKKTWSWKYCQTLWCFWERKSDLYFNGIVWEFYSLRFAMMMTKTSWGWGKILLHAASYGHWLYTKKDDSALRP